MPVDKNIKKVLVIGSGPIVIGQAAEFDYAGTQACRVLKEEGIEVLLVNSNPATIMTDKQFADEIYLEPLNVETVERIIEKERPEGLLAGLGGQTGLTIATQLKRRGTLDKYNVRLLGTPVEAIEKAEDRELFRETMEKIGMPLVPSETAESVPDALSIADKIGYPIIIRPAFTLGGTGGGIAFTPEELKEVAGVGISMSPIGQVLVEKYISGWKEIEFETMRDALGNAVAVCSMENVDPVGVHTGDSIVAAPALSLSDHDLNMLRQASLDIVAEIGIIGGCNCQFALKPDSSEFAVIEVNPRVSRSSALASKATGYPIAKITAKLGLGYTLSEIKHPVTGVSLKGFEPAVDYIVVKFPRWPFDKFHGSSRRLGTQMKATGEVMSIGNNFEQGLMKAIRGAEIGFDSLNAPALDSRPVSERLNDCDDRRIFTVYEAMKAGKTDDEIYAATKIDYWFLSKLRNILKAENDLKDLGLTRETYANALNVGFTDRQIRALGKDPGGANPIEKRPVCYRIVRTCEKIFGVERPYYYSVPDGRTDLCEARSFKRSGKPVIVVLGSGPIRIGQGIEFDYSSVHCVYTLRKLGYDVVIINNNPETVSTDYDISDRLYFEPLTKDDVLDILAVEKPVGVVVAFGGQTAIKLAKCLDEKGYNILGTSAEGIDLAEDRSRFDSLLEQFSIKRPKGHSVLTVEEAVNAAKELGYPVLLRPSFVIGGANMTIARDEATVRNYMELILSGGIENPVLIDKYMPGTELEVDVISDGKDVLIPGIMEHIERAGIHSGDSIAVYPPYNLIPSMLRRICDVSERLALLLGTKGLVNIQYLIFGGELFVIEVNPRASRTIPYISKVTGVEMVDIAVRVMLGEKLKDIGCGTGLVKNPPYFAVKVPVFSFEKLSDANSMLGPEMKSTGEVLGIGVSTEEALFKGIAAAGLKVPSGNMLSDFGVLLSVEDMDYSDAAILASRFSRVGMKIYATSGTAEAIGKRGTPVTVVPNSTETNDIIDLMEAGKIGLVIYTGAVRDGTIGDYILLHRRAVQLGIPCFTSPDTAGAFADVIESGFDFDSTELVDICKINS
ncbi:MAG: carbamoyl-phosphate synthase large subunit [Clostridia bacterium]|nr:carbamoyl-phosphate synthase large subunit [Clostridia bacterium]